ncbi:DinB family protein [Polaribacter sp. WD7]|uniref:DinB family protein n=1 Tax=Polaribacter sp. WD7 TaxID=2269061 RepID=UPI000DF249E2|nr:DinB family protein [Polaribacter sp. WD7]RCS27190.1 DinB family protein [Polaribacter sp. WD7]
MISKEEYASYFEQYIALVSNDKSIIENLKWSQQLFDEVLRNLSKDKHNYAYAEGKWTLKELMQHIIDTERIFGYRALCFARNDSTDLPGFDQDIFVANDNANKRDYFEMLDEMKTLRKSTIQLYESFEDIALLRIGTASGNKISVRALGYLFSGHQIHHLNIVKERYL